MLDQATADAAAADDEGNDNPDTRGLEGQDVSLVRTSSGRLLHQNVYHRLSAYNAQRGSDSAAAILGGGGKWHRLRTKLRAVAALKAGGQRRQQQQQQKQSHQSRQDLGAPQPSRAARWKPDSENSQQPVGTTDAGREEREAVVRRRRRQQRLPVQGKMPLVVAHLVPRSKLPPAGAGASVD